MIQTPVIVTFANQKGGVGKTTLCVTFANYLVKKGVRVVVIDCDFQHSIMKCRKADCQMVEYDKGCGRLVSWSAIQTTVQRKMPITERREYAGWNVERAFRIAKSKIEIRPMFHFTHKRIEAHICICLVALKVYKELGRMLKVSEIKTSVDKVLALAKTITTIQIRLPLNKEVYTQTMLMARHQKIAKLFDEDFWGTQ